LEDVMEYVEMICHLVGSMERGGAGMIPDGYEVGPLGAVGEDELYAGYHAAFQAGDACFFFEQSEVERREYFDTLGIEAARGERASLLVRKDGRLVGFTLVLPYGESNCHISCMCVRPEFQRQGIGALMLRRVMAGAVAAGYRAITLGTDTDMGAFQLYCKYGFEIVDED